MFNGYNNIGFAVSAKGNKKVNVFSTALQEYLPGEFTCATNEEINEAIVKANNAFEVYKNTSCLERAIFLECIAEEILNIGDVLIERAMLETGLTEARLTGERGRTVTQLRMFASLLREGSWVEAVVDTAMPERKPLPRADLRKMLYPIGPVAVFGASNFPFAFSTAGGDTAAALAAGCPVIVKAHMAHLGTNELVANAIIVAAQKSSMPDGVFSSLVGEGAQLGQALAKHPLIKAIGFTGSFRAGMALYKTAVNDREVPIPVYAEMSSINPVVLLPGKIEAEAEKTATQLAASITLGVGQFCTNPGLLFIIDNSSADAFIHKLAEQLQGAAPGTMLNQAICKSYYEEREKLVGEKGIATVFLGENESGSYKGSPALMSVQAADFVANPSLQNEIFGPASLIVKCTDQAQLLEAIDSLQGQLTGTVFGSMDDIQEYAQCIHTLTGKVGRIIYNSVPTGVEVCHAMIHGGPFPSTTDGRSTSVGADAIKRFVRPVCYQDCPADFLPDALKDDNPLDIMRKVDGNYTRSPINAEAESLVSE
jgi:NADP-dependent aldehyde dehydrogenase